MKLKTVFLALIFLYSFTPVIASSNSNHSEQSIKIDQDIEALKTQIKKMQIEVFNAEMKAQELLPVHWEMYSQKIEEVEKKEEKIKDLKLQVKELIKKKELLNRIEPRQKP